jgi:hypothetical protein
MALNPVQRSSLTNSIVAYMPYYAPPVPIQTSVERGHAHRFVDMRGYQQWTQHSRPVNRAPRTLGMRWMYGVIPQIFRGIRMVATGAVESTQFQPVARTKYNSTGFNDAIYQAGFPRNLGLSEKVPTVPPVALGTAPWQMLPAPRITRSIYVNRRPFTSGIPGVPATPTQGRHS